MAGPDLEEIRKKYKQSMEKKQITSSVQTKKSNAGWLIFVIIVIIGSFFVWHTKDVAVVGVVGKQIDTARNALLAQKLHFSVTEVFNDEVPRGAVISQYPEAGTTVEKQREIALVVSKGSKISTVPDLRGLNRRDAELQLKNADLVVGRIDEQFSSNAPSGTVINQSLSSSAQVKSNTPIDIVMSKGSEPKSSSLQQERQIIIFNNTGVDIYKLFIKPTNHSQWGEQRLDHGPLTNNNFIFFVASDDSKKNGVDVIVADLYGNEAKIRTKLKDSQKTTIVFQKNGWYVE